MNRISKMLIDVVKGILERPLSDDKLINFGGSKNIFYSRIRENSGHLPDGCAIVLKNVILFEVNKDKFKKNLIYDYYKYYLTNYEMQYCNRNKDDFESFITFALSKFLKPNSKLFKNSLKNYYSNTINKEITITSHAKKIEKLYKKLIESDNTDLDFKFSLLKRIQDSIYEVIIIIEGINESVHKRINILETVYAKNILPISISIQMKHIDNIIKSESKVIGQEHRNSLMESCILNTKNIVKWFFCEYIDGIYSNKDKKNYNFDLIKNYNLGKFKNNSIEIIRGNHIRLMEKQLEIVKTAKKTLATTGSRARNQDYLKAIEHVLSEKKDLEYYRVLFGYPYNEVLRLHLINSFNIIEQFEKEKGKRYLFLGYYRDTRKESEKFICANENQALVMLPSFERLMKYDSAIVFYDNNDASRMVEYVKQLFISSMDITIRNKLEKLKVYKKIARREIT
jgi:hypothetical protein